MSPSSWSRLQRRLHWWIAGLVVLGFALAWPMTGLSYANLLLKFLLHQAHKTIGITVFALAVVRLIVVARRGRPAMDPAMPPWRRSAARVAHGLLHVGLLAVPIAGYWASSLSPTGIPTLFLGVIPLPPIVAPNPAWFPAAAFAHRVAAFLLVGLAAAHAAAAIGHHLAGQNTLTRMWRG